MFDDYKPRKRSKSRSKKRRESHLNSVLRLSIWICLGVSCAMVVFCAVAYISNSDTFNVRMVKVEGLRQVPLDDILSKIDLAEGDNIFSWNQQNAREALEANPWIKDLRISRRFLPTAVQINVVEHQPAATLIMGDKRYYLTENGRIFVPAGEEDRGMLITIRDELPAEDELQQLILRGFSAIRIVEQQGLKVASLSISSGENMLLGLDSGLSLAFQSEITPRKAEMAMLALDKLGTMGKQVMDLSCEDKIILRDRG